MLLGASVFMVMFCFPVLIWAVVFIFAFLGWFARISRVGSPSRFISQMQRWKPGVLFASGIICDFAVMSA